jgi:hypothetical protein
MPGLVVEFRMPACVVASFREEHGAATAPSHCALSSLLCHRPEGGQLKGMFVHERSPRILNVMI